MTTSSTTSPVLTPVRRTDRFFYLWALLLPVTSFLVIPSVQGTTPSYILAILLMGLLPLLSRQGTSEYYETIALFVAFFGLLAVLSQLGLIMRSSPPDTSELLLVRPALIKVYLRSTLFTQSLYLLCCISLFAFVRVYYNPRWDKYIYMGAVLLALYGLYEWTYYLASGSSGDFISNRVFVKDDEMGTEGGGEGTGSLMQAIQLGPLALLRLKSLTGEPSMYSFAILPYWIYATHTRRWIISLLLLFTLLLTTSTTAMLGIAVYAICSITDRKTLWFKIGAVLLGCLIFLLYRDIALDALNFVFTDKMSSESGTIRSDQLWAQLDFFFNSDLWIQLFGLGFGYTRSGSLIFSMLINCGIVGVTATIIFMLYPVFRLGANREENAIRHALLVLFIASLASVPEFAYPPLWLFLGMAYYRLRTPEAQRRTDRHLPHNIPRSPSAQITPP